MSAAVGTHDPASKLLADLGAWAGNVSTSVFIVFINKLLMKNYGYHFATTLVGAAACRLWAPTRPPARPSQLARAGR